MGRVGVKAEHVRVVTPQVREGELGEGRYGDTSGRTEGFYAALQEAPDRLRASDLNEVLLPDHLERLRFTNFPLQAYGAIFKWDTLIDDVLFAYRRPWQVVAEAHDLRMPDDDEVLRAVGMRPERAIQQTFSWSNDWGQTQQLAFEHYEAKVSSRDTHANLPSRHRAIASPLYPSRPLPQADLMAGHEFSPADGVLPWLEVLNEYQVPCCLCAGTSLDKAAVEQVLEKAGLKDFFETAVTAEDGCETAEQSYLVGSIKLRRPPSRCVVFEDDPRGVAAAHEATSKAVAILGRHYGSDLRHADMRVSGFDELSLMSLRELFKDQAPV